MLYDANLATALAASEAADRRRSSIATAAIHLALANNAPIAGQSDDQSCLSELRHAQSAITEAIDEEERRLTAGKPKAVSAAIDRHLREILMDIAKATDKFACAAVCSDEDIAAFGPGAEPLEALFELMREVHRFAELIGRDEFRQRTYRILAARPDANDIIEQGA